MTIYAISIASNFDKAHNTQLALTALKQLGECEISPIYQIPCRDGIGADYWNCACLLQSICSVEHIEQQLKLLEQQTGRKRPSHQISLDMDLIAWGQNLNQMQFNEKKMPLAQDVIIPLQMLWSMQEEKIEHHYPQFCPKTMQKLTVSSS